MAKQKNKPIIIKSGRGIRAKLWKNSGDNGDWFNVQISRVYKDLEGDFQDSDNFSRDDLLHVALAAQMAFQYMLAEPQDEN